MPCVHCSSELWTKVFCLGELTSKWQFISLTLLTTVTCHFNFTSGVSFISLFYQLRMHIILWGSTVFLCSSLISATFPDEIVIGRCFELTPRIVSTSQLQTAALMVVGSRTIRYRADLLYMSPIYLNELIFPSVYRRVFSLRRIVVVSSHSSFSKSLCLGTMR